MLLPMPYLSTCRRLMLPVEVRESGAVRGETAKQGRRLPEFIAVAFAKFLDAAEHRLQPYRVGVEHGTAAPGGESVAVEVDDVDIRRSQGDSLAEDMRAFIHQREDGAIDNFVTIYR